VFLISLAKERTSVEAAIRCCRLLRKARLTLYFDPLEDILTGAVFGTIAYVECNTALEMLRALLGSDERIPLPRIVTKIRMRLWPRDSSDSEEGHVEPDVLIDLFLGHEQPSLRMIIESKWNARLGPNQAIKQWKCFSAKAEQTWHIFPVRDIVSVEQDLESQDLLPRRPDEMALFTDWKQCRCCISWYDIARSLLHFSQKIAGSPDRAHLRCWALGVLSVLKFLDAKPFEGFRNVSPPFLEEHAAGSNIFWTGVGTRQFRWPLPVNVGAFSPLFFDR
jgi:hypothetical protein